MASSARRSVDGNTRPLALSQLPTALRLTPSEEARSAWDIPALTRAVRMRVLSFIGFPCCGGARAALRTWPANWNVSGSVRSAILTTLVQLRCQNRAKRCRIGTYFEHVSNTDCLEGVRPIACPADMREGRPRVVASAPWMGASGAVPQGNAGSKRRFGWVGGSPSTQPDRSPPPVGSLISLP